MSCDQDEPRVGFVAITRHSAARLRLLAVDFPGATLFVAERFAPLTADLPNPVVAYPGPLRGQVAGLFGRFDQIVFFVSLGAVVRLIAPHLRSKHEDPGVLVVDDAARFVIPVISGHIGGANAFARELAARLRVQAIVTTASDVGGTLAVDLLGRELGWRRELPEQTVAGDLTRIAARVVNGEPIAFVQEAGRRDWWRHAVPLPRNIHLFDQLEAVDLDRYAAILWVTHREVPVVLRTALAGRLILYRPPLAGGSGETSP